MYTVYLRKTPDDKVYVGCTSKTVEERAGAFGIGYRQNQAFWEAIQRFGWESITTSILYRTEDLEEAQQVETKFIQELKATDPAFGYNRIDSGFSMSEERIQHLRVVGKQNWNNPEIKDKAISRRRAIETEEHRKHVSESIKRKWKDPNYRERVSRTLKARYQEPENRKLLSESVKKVWTPEKCQEHSRRMKEVMSNPEIQAKLKASKSTPEYLEKFRRTRSLPEVKQRCSQSMQAAWNREGYRENMSQKMHAKRWMTRDGVNRRIDEDQVEAFLADGWIFGKSKKEAK